jgi:site-specific DNA recombinase
MQRRNETITDPPFFRLGVATHDVVIDELNELKRERESDQKRLASLIQTKEKLAKMVDMEASLKDLCAKIIPDLDHCSNDDKKDAYTYLGLQVKATPEGADIKGFLDPCLLTTVQTWA